MTRGRDVARTWLFACVADMLSQGAPAGDSFASNPAVDVLLRVDKPVGLATRDKVLTVGHSRDNDERRVDTGARELALEDY